MPLSLGQAIGGNFNQDYNVVDPLIKGFQLGEARQRRKDLIDLKKDQALQKENDALLSAAQRSINFTNLDPLIRDKYTEKARGILSEATVAMSSNDPLERQQGKLALQGLIGLTGSANAESKILSTLRTRSAKGELNKEQEKLFQEAQKAGDLRLFGEIKSPYWGGGITKDGAFIATPINRVDVDKAIKDNFSRYAQQHVSEGLSQYPHLMNEFVGLPKDEEDKKRVLGKDYNAETASSIRTAEDELGDMFDNSVDIQNNILDKYDEEIAKKFPSKDGQPIVLNPEARLYARDKFIKDNKDKATFSRKTRSIPQEAGQGGGYDEAKSKVQFTSGKVTPFQLKQSMSDVLQANGYDIEDNETELVSMNLPETGKKIEYRDKKGNILKGEPNAITYVPNKATGKGGEFVMSSFGMDYQTDGQSVKGIPLLTESKLIVDENVIGKYSNLLKTIDPTYNVEKTLKLINDQLKAQGSTVRMDRNGKPVGAGSSGSSKKGIKGF